MMHATRKHRRKGFTLVEAAITTVIVGLGTVAMMALLSAGTNTNQQTALLTTAVHLADDIHELGEQLTYPTSGSWGMPSGQTISGAIASGNISWLDAQTFNAPIDATGTAISGMSDWTQQVSVTNVNANNISKTLSSNAVTNPLSRVTVTVLFNGQQIYQTDWLVAQ